MTEAMIRLWCRQWAYECAAPSPSVLTPEQMNERIEEHLATMPVPPTDSIRAGLLGCTDVCCLDGPTLAMNAKFIARQGT